MERKTPRTFQVVVDVNAANHVSQCLLRGILRFARERGDWGVIVNGAGKLDAALPSLVIDGFIGGKADSTRRCAPSVLGRKTVELTLDGGSVGRLAAEHFVERGFVQFAFVGEDRSPAWSTDRLAAFRRELASRGLPCAVYVPVSGTKRGDLSFQARHLASWLAAQPRPLAVLAAFDARARQVLEACRLAGLDVPGDVAVLGVDDDPLECETNQPTISSVALNGEEAGYAAAAALDAAMRGGGGRPRRIVVGGARVETRASTARFVGRDPLVAKARAAIAGRLRERLPVSELARELGVSRRTLELRFRADAGLPVGEAILRARLERAKTLLRMTPLPCEEIAAACGVCTASHLANLFRRKFGAPPSSFRTRAP